MKPLLMAILLLLITSVPAVPQHTPSKTKLVSISIPRVAGSPGERIVSFEIDVTAGMVQSVSNLPKGWYLAIDNDASWQTKVTGNTLVGAAALSPEDFRKIHVVVEKDESDEKFALAGTVSVTKDFEKERSLPLTMRDFAVRSRR